MSTPDKPVLLLAFANDRDDRARYLRNLPEEQRRVRQTLQAAVRAGLCELVERANATLSDVIDLFQDPRYRGRIAVFHFGGHAGGEALLLESDEGAPTHAHASGLAALLGAQPALQLVFLNGCSSRGQVEGLLDAGVRAVIATSQAIDDAVATAFSIHFYQGLAAGAGVDNAYRMAEAAVRTHQGEDPRHTYRAFSASPSDAPGLPLDHWPWDLYVRPGEERNVAEWNLPDAAGNPLFGLPPLPQTDLPTRPFRHLQWFGRDEAELFFGREREVRALYERVTAANAAPIILLYGQSGVGKSSLLAAGLLPRLEATHAVQYLRRQPEAGLAETLQEGLQALATTEHPLDQARDEGLQENALSTTLPALLRQADTAFQNQRLDDAARALDQLLQTLHPLREALRARPATSALRDAWLRHEHQSGRPLVLVLDQVEEAFTRQSPAAAAAEMAALLRALQSVFTRPDERPRGRLLLSFRKEWEPEIAARCEEAGLPFTSVFLERLDRNGTLEAIRGVARTPRLQQHYGLTLAPGLAEEIADDLLADPDSPLAPTLQILLTKMWTEARRRDRDHPLFDAPLYRSLKSQGILLQDFLDEQLAALHDWNPEAAEAGLILDVLARHTTPLGTAATCTLPELQQAYAHQAPLLPGLLDACEHHYLLVKSTQAATADAEAVVTTRLAHDTLAPLVRHRYEASDRPGQRAARILNQRAVEWQQGAVGNPLDAVDLATVEAGATGMHAWNDDERRLLKASSAARTHRRRMRRALQAGAIAAMFLIAGSGIFAWLSKQESDRQAAISLATALGAQAQDLTDAPQVQLLLATEALRALRDQTPDTRIAAVEDNYHTALTRLDGEGLDVPWRQPPAVPETFRGQVFTASTAFVGPRGRWFVEGHVESGSGHVTLYDLWAEPAAASARDLGRLRWRADYPLLSFTGDGQWLLTARTDSTIVLWHLGGSDAPQRAHTYATSAAITDFTVSPDDRWLVVAADTSLLLWNLITPEAPPLRRTLPRARIVDVALSPDGRRLASAHRDSTVRLWDFPLTATSQPTILPDAAPVNAYLEDFIPRLRFSPKGRWLALMMGRPHPPAADEEAPSPINQQLSRLRVWDMSTQDISIPPRHRDYPFLEEHVGGNERWPPPFFSPDDRFLLTITNQHYHENSPLDIQLTFWGLQDLPPSIPEGLGIPITRIHRTPERVLDAAHGRIEQVAWRSPVADFTRDGQWFFTSDPSGVYMLNLHADTAFTLPGARPPVRFSHDEQMLATSSPDNVFDGGCRHGSCIYLWHPESPTQPVDTLVSLYGVPGNLAFSPDDRWLLSAPYTVSHLADGRTHRLTRSSQALTNPPPSFDAQSHVLLPFFDEAGDFPAGYRRWDLNDSTFTHPWHARSEIPISLSPGRRWLLTMEDLGTGHLWDLQHPGPAHLSLPLPGLSECLIHLDFSGCLEYQRQPVLSADGRWLVARHLGWADDYAQMTGVSGADLWEVVQDSLPQPHLVQHLDARTDGIDNIHLSPDSRWALVRYNRSTALLDLSASPPRPVTPPRWRRKPDHARFSPDGRYLALTFSTEDPLNPETNKIEAQLFDLAALDRPPRSFSTEVNGYSRGRWGFSPDGRLLLLGHQLFEVASGEVHLTLDDTASYPPPVFSRSGHWLVAAGHLWDLRRTSPPIPLPRDVGFFAAFSPDARWLLLDDALRPDIAPVLCVTQSRPLTCHRLDGAFLGDGEDASLRLQFAFSADNRWLATATDNRDAVLLWHLTPGTAPASPIRLPGNHLIVDFTEDHRYLRTTGTGQELLQRWPLDLNDMIERGCRAAGRNLSRAEWQQYLPGQPYRPTCLGLPLDPD